MMPKAERRYCEDWIPAGVLAGVIIAANGLMLQSAHADRSWGALGIAVFLSPIVNLILLITGAAITPIVFHASVQERHPVYLWTAFGLPVIAFFADFLIIGSFPLHGC